MNKITKYEKIPEFDQENYMVIQKKSEEKSGEIYFGVEVVKLPKQKEGEMELEREKV